MRAFKMLMSALLISGGVTVGSSHPAQAICGLNDEYSYPITTSWGKEEGYGDPQCGPFGTSYPYGNDGHYRGRVRDLLTDGSCVSVRYADDGYNAVQASSCDSAGTVYHYYDSTGTSAFVRIERNQGAGTYYYSEGY